MTKDFSVREYQTEDVEEIVTLLRLCFEDWTKIPDPIEYWKSRYENDPYGTGILVAISEGRIIGVNINLFLQMKIGSKIVPAQYESGSATHPDYRSLGVYKRLTAKAREQSNAANIKFSYFTSENPYMIKRAKENDYFVFPHPVNRMIKVKNVGLFLKQRHLKNETTKLLGFKTLKIANKLRRSITPIHRKNPVNINKTESLDERIDNFWQKLETSYDFLVKKDKKCLNWKYSDRRVGEFTIRQAVENSEVLGFSVLETRKRGETTEGYIQELLTRPDRPDVASALIEDASKFYNDTGANAIHCLCIGGHPYGQLYENAGFISAMKRYISGNFRQLEGFTNQKAASIIGGFPSSRTQFSLGDL